ncbi:hypothetical protein OTU49_003799, partial [Cherax quadricarinatus]
KRFDKTLGSGQHLVVVTTLLVFGGAQEAPQASVYIDAAYNDYLDNVLADYGIRFSPGGSGIEEIDVSPEKSEEDKEVLEVKPFPFKNEVAESKLSSAISRPTTSLRLSEVISRPTTTKRKADSDLGSDEDLTLTIDESGSSREVPTALPSLPHKIPHRKLKVYQREPFQDPAQEKRRINAILAKQNRDQKKKQIQDLKETVQKLQRVNMQCNKALRRTNNDVQQLRLHLQSYEASRSYLEEKVKNQEIALREQRDKFMLFREHLDLITSSLDDDNTTKKLISALLKRLSGETSL